MSQEQYPIYLSPSDHQARGDAPAFHRPFTSNHNGPEAQLQELPRVFDYRGPRPLPLNSSNNPPSLGLGYTPTSGIYHGYTLTPSFDPPPRQEWQETFKAAKYKSQFSQNSEQKQHQYVQYLQEFVLRWVVEWWLLEIVSWICSAICMAAIIGVMFYYDGKELPEWSLGITLNGFITVFSNIAKSAMLLPTAEALGQHRWNWFRKKSRTLMDFEILDAASRGPWGCLLLMLRATQARGL
jgi:hypothetical protein